MTRIKLLGVKVDILEEEEMYEKILKLSTLERPSRVILLDMFLLIKAKLHKDLFEILNSADLVIPISKTIHNGISFLNKKFLPVSLPPPVLSSFTFTIRLLSCFTENNKTVYLLGGTKKLIIGAEKNLKDSYPGIKLMGVYHTKYKKEFETKLLTSIYKITPSLLIVSKPRPKLERWLCKNRHSFPNGVSIGVENFVYEIGEKMLKPTDKLRYNFIFSLKRALRKPLCCYYFLLYFFYLIIYKLFKLDNKGKKVKREKLKMEKKKR